MIRLVTFDFWETLVADRADQLAAQEALRVEAIGRALAAAGAGLSRAGSRRPTTAPRTCWSSATGVVTATSRVPSR